MTCGKSGFPTPLYEHSGAFWSILEHSGAFWRRIREHSGPFCIEHSVRVRIPLLKAYVTRTTAATSLLGAFAAANDPEAWLFGLVSFESTFAVSTSGAN